MAKRKRKIPALVGTAEVCEILGWGSKGQLTMTRRRGLFPDPIQELKSGPIWLEEDVLEYKQQRDEKRAAMERQEQQADEDIKAGRLETITNEQELDAYFERLNKGEASDV